METNYTASIIKHFVQKELELKGINAYFISFEIDDGTPYMVYTFDESIISEAKKMYNDGFTIKGVYDDYINDLDDPIKDAISIIEDRYRNINLK
jgi:hypothetical protein